jgi:hypothetical protein
VWQLAKSAVGRDPNRAENGVPAWPRSGGLLTRRRPVKGPLYVGRRQAEDPSQLGRVHPSGSNRSSRHGHQRGWSETWRHEVEISHIITPTARLTVALPHKKNGAAVRQAVLSLARIIVGERDAGGLWLRDGAMQQSYLHSRYKAARRHANINIVFQRYPFHCKLHSAF